MGNPICKRYFIWGIPYIGYSIYRTPLIKVYTSYRGTPGWWKEAGMEEEKAKLCHIVSRTAAW